MTGGAGNQRCGKRNCNNLKIPDSRGKKYGRDSPCRWKWTSVVCIGNGATGLEIGVLDLDSARVSFFHSKTCIVSGADNPPPSPLFQAGRSIMSSERPPPKGIPLPSPSWLRSKWLARATSQLDEPRWHVRAMRPYPPPKKIYPPPPSPRAHLYMEVDDGPGDQKEEEGGA